MITKTKDHPVSTENFSAGPVALAAHRITSIDLLRGVVMIIMALDHVRDYFHAGAYLFDPTDFSKTNEFLFFTRWITHFCAPVFMFLAGTSAFFVGRRKTKNQLANFLLTRGLWLIFLELTVVNFAWYFDIGFSNIEFAVIWALGASMIALAGLIYLPYTAILAVGLLIVSTHNLLDKIEFTGNTLRTFLWSLLHQQQELKFFGKTFWIGYPILSWIGVMALGYCFGRLYTSEFTVERRRKWLLAIGITAIILFFLLRSINVYGDLRPWTTQSSSAFTVMSFFNLQKYPPSLLYILMTLGPALLFLAFTEKLWNQFTRVVSVFGRVPMFYYILHLFLIHGLAEIVALVMGFNWHDKTIWMNVNPELKGFGFSLGVTYLIWIGIILMLYPLCRWYDKYKMANKQKWWLSYL